LNYHIGRSAAPCIGAISKEDYDGIIADVVAFLEGRVDHLIREREAGMREAAREMDFERAAKLRDELSALTHVRDRQQATIATEDSFRRLRGARRRRVGLRAGLRRAGGPDRQPRLVSFWTTTARPLPAPLPSSSSPQYYGYGNAVPREVLVKHGRSRGGSGTARGAPLGAKGDPRRGTSSRRGDKRRVLEMAEKNARLGLEHEKLIEESQRNRVASTLDALREELALPRLPVRIECYDISNTMGTNSVASMVVFQGGRPAKDQYRRFKIRTVEGADDFASMAEVIRRGSSVWRRGTRSSARYRTSSCLTAARASSRRSSRSSGSSVWARIYPTYPCARSPSATRRSTSRADPSR
jgi:excinuclease ABC subunit C